MQGYRIEYRDKVTFSLNLSLIIGIHYGKNVSWIEQMIFSLRYEFTKCLQNEGFVKKENGQTRSGTGKEKEKMIQDQIKNPDLWDSVFL